MKTKSELTEEDLVFSALADKNRRKIVELLHAKDSTLMELSELFSDFSFQALSKHINKLERAGILHKRKEGKYRVLSLNRHAFRESLRWMSFYSNFWNESFDQLDALIQQKKSDGPAI
ncbi:MAG: metalloregulator ArsR/SmtB family transcription factor [Bacteroidota bacterium]